MLSSSLNRTRAVGVEIEMAVPLIGGGSPHDLRIRMAKILSDNGVRAAARNYTHAPVGEGLDVVVEHDGSIFGESVYKGIEWVQVEVKTRILNGTADFDAVVKQLCDICRYLGARQNRSTGVHLHVDFPELRGNADVMRSFFAIAHRCESVFYGLVAPSRRNNSYCKPIQIPPRSLRRCKTMTAFQRVLTEAGYDRYWGFNLTHAFGSRPRIEFRHHQGSLDFDKLKHWRNLCLRLVDHAVQRNCKTARSQLVMEKASLLRMLVTLGLKPNTRVFKAVDPELRATGRYLLRRWRQLNPPPPPTEPPPIVPPTTPIASEDSEGIVPF